MGKSYHNETVYKEKIKQSYQFKIPCPPKHRQLGK